MSASKRARTSWGAIAVALVLAAGGYVISQGDIDPPPQASLAAAPSLTSSTELQARLQALPVLEPTAASGYDRSCSPGDGCVFGPAWSDDSSAPMAHNGCDTRNDVLRASLTDVTVRPGTKGCVVESGTLLDPYSGEQVAFVRARASEVQIDHLIPLAYAWRHGAAEWPLDKRMTFANDPENLRATIGSINQTKGDSGPEDWMPAIDQCGYATSFVRVAADYGLSITPGDRDVLAAACPVE